MDQLMDLFGSDEGKSKRDSLPPEIEEGNIEYKLKLLNPTASRFEHLVTQLKWRLQEGQGEAIYEIGVADCGTLLGLNEMELEMSIDTLMKMAQKLGATATVLRKREVLRHAEPEQYWVVEVLVRKVPDDQQFLDIRLAVLGNMEAGKSTLLGVLTQGELDNGRGKARLNLFRHLHEIQSGHTSSISLEIMGLSSNGEVINYSTHASADDICEASAKLITFIDLAGHHKYLKTTVFGLTACRPDFAMLVVGANSGVVGTTCEHLGFCIALKVPIMVIVSKIDLCTKEQVEYIVRQLEELLTNPGCNKVPRRVRTENDVYATAQRFSENSICPIFLVSSVTGQNLQLVTKFLNAVPKQVPRDQLEQEETEFQVDEIYTVPEVGMVVGGTLTSGTLREGDKVKVGPNERCQFVTGHVISVHRYRSPCRLVKAGQAATLAISGIERPLFRKGMVVLGPPFMPTKNAKNTWKFSANIFLLHHTASGLRRGFQSTLYVASVMQTVIVDNIEGEQDTLSQGQKGCVHFRFQRHPEFLRVGWRILFRDGQTRGMGEITCILPGGESTVATGNNKRSPSPHR